MKSQHLLSNDQHDYITSQNVVPNPSEQRRRISEKIEQAFNTFDIILTHETVPRKFVDDLFPARRIYDFLRTLIRYEQENSVQKEANKQSIAQYLLSSGFQYFQDRYKETFILKKQIEDIDSAIRSIDYISRAQQEDNEAMALYRARSRSKAPPNIVPEKDFWVAECIYCFNFSYGNNKTEEEAIKNLQHTKGCMFLKDIKRHDGRHRDLEVWRYIRTIPPREDKKKK